MTLDELIETLQALRVRYPAAASSFVRCSIDLEVLRYDRGEVRLGVVYDEDDDARAGPARIHQFPDRTPP